MNIENDLSVAMYMELKKQLKEYEKANNKEKLIKSIYQQILTLKEVLEPTSYKWFNSKIDKSIEKLEKCSPQDEIIQNTIIFIMNLRFNLTQTHERPTSQYADRNSVQYIHSVITQFSQVHIPGLNSSQGVTTTSSLQNASIQNPPKQTISEILSDELSKAFAYVKPENWVNWHKKSIGNHLGYIIRYFITLDKYPLEKDECFLVYFLNILESPSVPHSYHHCKDAIRQALTRLRSNEIDSQQKAKNILHSLMQEEPLRTVIVDELKEAINPIIQYLAGIQKFSRDEIISQLKEFQNILRRWCFIEMDREQTFGSQSDPSECLQALYNFLQEPNDQYSSTKKNEVHWQATISQNESDWNIEEIRNFEFDYQFLESLVKHITKTHPKNDDFIEACHALFQNIISTGSVRDLRGKEIEDLPSLDHALKQRNQKMKLPLFLHAYGTNETLLENNSIEDNLKTMFGDVSHFHGYRVQHQILQRINLPVKTTTTSFSGEYPEVLMIQHVARFANPHEMDLTKINIPQVISFNNIEYELSKASVKSGNQNGGHYTFFSVNSEGKSLYADSLTEEDFILDDIALSKILSEMANVTLLEYQRRDIDRKNRVIKQKLYQGQDHLCYLIQVLYFIYGNPSFSSINQIFIKHHESQTKQPEEKKEKSKRKLDEVKDSKQLQKKHKINSEKQEHSEEIEGTKGMED